jgi:flagellar biosynthesis protein FliQ
MTPESIITLGEQTTMAVLLVSAPMMIISTIVGILITIFQTVTQLRDQTLTFIPKIVSIILALIIFMPFMIQIIVTYTVKVFMMQPGAP